MNWDERNRERALVGPDPYLTTREVLDGRRVELDEVGRKVLRIVLSLEGGCDLVITPVNFEGMWAKALQATEYDFASAPAVVSELLRLADLASPAAQVRAFVGPGLLDTGIGFGRKVLWLTTTQDRVVIQLRTASGSDEEDLTEAPQPYPGLLVPALCPYCGQVLRTPMAKQCRFCKRDWHDPGNPKWLGQPRNSTWREPL